MSCDGQEGQKETRELTPARARAAVEALIFASPEPVKAENMARILGLDEETVRFLAADLEQALDERGSGMRLRQTAGGYELVTRPEFAWAVGGLLDRQPSGPLSPAALEVLAVIAYRQPVTRAEIESIRGVRSDSALETLEERGFIHAVGRKDAPGRPLLFGTTPAFLRHFGLRSLVDLPGRETGDQDGLLAALPSSTPASPASEAQPE